MNTTGSINVSSLYQRPWLRDEIFVSILTVIALYLNVALAIFEYNKNRKKDPKENSKKIQDFLSDGSLCLVAAVFVLIRCCLEQIELRLGRESNLACRIYQHLLVEVYHLSLTCLYILLWMRQLKMYRHRALRHLSTKPLRIASYGVLFGILASSIASAASYLVTFTLIASPQGCVYDLSFPDGPPSSLPGYLLFAISFVFQFSLLALLLNPLMNHYRIQICRSSDVDPPKTKKNVRETIIRLTVCTTICVLSDGVSSSLLIFVHDATTPIMFWANVYTTNLILNVVTVVCSFADWKERLFPCLKSNFDAVLQTSGSNGSSAV